MPRIPEETKFRTSEAFRERMLSIIDERELTKKDFAKAANVNKEIIIRATVYGIVPSVKSLMKIADYLQCSIDYLLGKVDKSDFVRSETEENFYARLQALADEKSIKLSALSHSLSFAPNSVYEWIRTNSLPSLEYLYEIAGYFKVSVDYLLGRTDYRD